MAKDKYKPKTIVDLPYYEENKKNEVSHYKSPINQAERDFINLVVGGYSLKEAYQMTFPAKCKGKTEIAIISCASRLNAKPKLQKYKQRQIAIQAKLVEANDRLLKVREEREDFAREVSQESKRRRSITSTNIDEVSLTTDFMVKSM